jgi:hypothetical protein
MTDKDYHPDGFLPMQNASMEGFTQMPKGKMSDDIAAFEKGLAFFSALKADKIGDGVTLTNIAHPINPDSIETIEIELPEVQYEFNKAFTQEQLWPIVNEFFGKDMEIYYDFARAVERAHGII